MKYFLCSHLVTLRWDGRETGANLEKICAASATANAEEALPAGASIVIWSPTCELSGTVSACETDPTGYLVEIALDVPWSPELFAADHLTDPDLFISAQKQTS
jgi:hypothetical protein